MAPRKLQILLDLDETLVNYVDMSLWNKLDDSEKSKYIVSTTSEPNRIIVVRPNIREFLEFIFTNCDVSIFSMAVKSHADEVANLVTDGHPENFKNIWSTNDESAASSIMEISKDLRYLWYVSKPKIMYPANTILIDDLEENTDNESNRNNVIKIPEFKLFKGKEKTYNDLSDDKTLLNAMKLIQDVLADPEFRDRPRGKSVFNSLQTVSSNMAGGRGRRTRRKRRSSCKRQ